MQNRQSAAEQELEATLKELISTPMGRRSFLAALPFLMASCATVPQTRHREGDNTGQQTELTYEDEKKMTQEVLPKMRKDYPPIQNSEMQSYINDLGQKIVHANGLHGNPYTYNFTVVGVDYVNAFALPAGTVFVTAPLITMADTEAELAGVVGHEIGHIQARHTAERMEKAKREQSKSWMYAVGGGILGGAIGFGLGKLLCPPKDNKCLTKAAGLGAAAGAGGGFLIQKYAFMAHSREDEMEADRIGFRTSVKAGFDKDRVGDFYTKLQRMEEQRKAKGGNAILGPIADAMSTHPPSRERVAQMNQMEQQTPKRGGSITSSKRFDQIKKLTGSWQRANAKG